MKRFGLLLFILCFSGFSFVTAQEKTSINIPDVLGYKTLTSDLHTHTVFSDGHVWPTIRIEEAWQEGMDIIAITDHLESTNLFRIKSLFGDDLEVDREGGFYLDRNRSHEIVTEVAENRDIFALRGTEISRTMPPGHHNAIFLTDVNKVNTPHPQWKEAFLAAKDQGAFIFWNHPASFHYPETTTLWWEEHTWLLENDMMHGIEVVNGRRYDPVAHQWAIEKNLAIIANTDIHGPIGMSYDIHKGEKRTMTLIFAKERSPDGIKEALFARRTMAYYENKLIGDRNFLDAIFFSSVTIESVQRLDNGFQVIIYNHSDIPFELSKTEGNDPDLTFFESKVIPANKQTTIKIYTENPASVEKIDLNVVIDNLLISPGEGLPVLLTFIPE
jgi:3',5'-nucleoside bisphosphate phosphatase